MFHNGSFPLLYFQEPKETCDLYKAVDLANPRNPDKLVNTAAMRLFISLINVEYGLYRQYRDEIDEEPAFQIV